MTLPSSVPGPVPVPPMMLSWVEEESWTPDPPLGRGLAPSARVPIRFRRLALPSPRHRKAPPPLPAARAVIGRARMESPAQGERRPDQRLRRGKSGLRERRVRNAATARSRSAANLARLARGFGRRHEGALRQDRAVRLVQQGREGSIGTVRKLLRSALRLDRGPPPRLDQAGTVPAPLVVVAQSRQLGEDRRIGSLVDEARAPQLVGREGDNRLRLPCPPSDPARGQERTAQAPPWSQCVESDEP